MDYVIDTWALPSVAVADQEARFPVHRIYCVGVNYRKHAAEMQRDPSQPPCFFSKFPDALVSEATAVHYPAATENLHHEVELVVAIGRGGRDVAADAALEHVFGYAVGLDMTRRDLQTVAVSKGQPWDTAKSFDESAPLSAVHPAASVGHPSRGRIWLEVNGSIRQDADLSEMIWGVPDIIAALSKLYTLRPGDLIFTGTPEGVGPVTRGDRIRAGIYGLATLELGVV